MRRFPRGFARPHAPRQNEHLAKQLFKQAALTDTAQVNQHRRVGDNDHWGNDSLSDWTIFVRLARTLVQRAAERNVMTFKDKNGKERMKGFKDELSAKEIEELVAYIRKFKK